jgi:hypothetical protein
MIQMAITTIYKYIYKKSFEGHAIFCSDRELRKIEMISLPQLRDSIL